MFNDAIKCDPSANSFMVHYMDLFWYTCHKQIKSPQCITTQTLVIKCGVR